MKAFCAAAIAVLVHPATALSSLYDLSAIDIDGNEVSLAALKGNVSVIMNVATF